MRKNNLKISSVIVYMIPTLFFVVVSIMFFYEAKKIADFRDNATIAKGILLETDLRYDDDNQLKYYGKYEYEVNGQKYSVWSKYGKSLKSDLRKEIHVYYAARNPKDSRIEIDTKYIHKNIFMGVLLLVGTGIVAYYNYRSMSKFIGCDSFAKQAEMELDILS